MSLLKKGKYYAVQRSNSRSSLKFPMLYDGNIFTDATGRKYGFEFS